MEATKSTAPAKPGDIAPEDIIVKEGETPFKPGPIVGELQKAGIPAAIEGGKIVIRKDKVLVEKGHSHRRGVEDRPEARDPSDDRRSGPEGRI